MIRLFIFISLLLPLSTYAENKFAPILNSIKPYNITIIGETHKRPESFQLFKTLIDKYLQQNNCLIVALEIASNQQSVINQVTQDKTKISDVEISFPVDHPDFRTLIIDLTEIQKNNNCFKLIAIDAHITQGINRDTWMATKLIKQVGEIPILVLLGSLHTLKKVIWNHDITNKNPYVAEILTNKGYAVNTYPQIWEKRGCGTSNSFILTKENETKATKLVANNLFSLLNASKPKNASNITDGVILWECEQ